MASEMIEFCRECRDKWDVIVPADFIIWGKLAPKEKLGPRCYDHTRDYVGPDMHRIEQWAIFDLRPYQKKRPALGVQEDGGHGSGVPPTGRL